MPDIVPPSVNPQPDALPQPPDSNPLPPTVSSTPEPLSPVAPQPTGQVFDTPPPVPSPYASFRPEQQPTVSPFQAAPPIGLKPSRKRLWVAVAAIAVALLAAAGYALAFYLPNTPGRVYSASLVNSGKAIDMLIDYSKKQAQANYQSASFVGTVNVKTGGNAYAVNLSGAGDKQGDISMQVSASLAATKLNFDLRSVHTSASMTPDVYIKVGGIKSLLNAYGLNKFDSLDGGWIVIDHTLTDKYSSSRFKVLSQSATAKPPTTAQVQDAEDKVQIVNKQYLFTTDPAKAVLANQTYLGKVKQNGRTLDHYKVGYNKAHLAAYVTAVSAALDSSQLNDWFKNTDKGKSISQALNLHEAVSTIGKSKGNYTFELFADTKTKLVSKLTFVDSSNQSNTFSIGQSYTGGSKYPFSLSFSDKEKGTTTVGSIGLTLDTATNRTDANMSISSGTVDVTSDFVLTPSKQPITVTAPIGAKSITSVLKALGLGSLTNGRLLTSAAGSANSPLTLLR